MQVQESIGFNQLLRIVKTLNNDELLQLKAVIEADINRKPLKVDLEFLLLNGPVASEKQLDIISFNRKAINQWRTL